MFVAQIVVMVSHMYVYAQTHQVTYIKYAFCVSFMPQ